jgi:hypothetical protein
VLNITNTVKAAATGTGNRSFGNAAFGRVDTQRGFMRLTQLMFRYRSNGTRAWDLGPGPEQTPEAAFMGRLCVVLSTVNRDRCCVG